VVASKAFLILSLGLAANACATSRMGEAVVRMQNGQVCFAPADAELHRPGAVDVVGVSVSDLTPPKATSVWHLQLPPNLAPLRLAQGECLAYGAKVASAIQSEPAQLKPSTLYSVAIRSELRDSADPTRAFRAEFCLLVNPDQSLRVHQIRWDAKTGKWQRDACSVQ
jgi:hypothetical protein